MLFVPDLVIAFITAPLNFPYSASTLLVSSRNSSTQSRLGTKPAPSFRPALTSPPFTRKAFAVSRWPFTERLPGCKLPDTGRSRWIASVASRAAPPARNHGLRAVVYHAKNRSGHVRTQHDGTG